MLKIFQSLVRNPVATYRTLTHLMAEKKMRHFYNRHKQSILVLDELHAAIHYSIIRIISEFCLLGQAAWHRRVWELSSAGVDCKLLLPPVSSQP